MRPRAMSVGLPSAIIIPSDQPNGVTSISTDLVAWQPGCSRICCAATEASIHSVAIVFVIGLLSTMKLNLTTRLRCGLIDPASDIAVAVIQFIIVFSCIHGEGHDVVYRGIV
jgi:hypothetical protein